MVTKWLTFGKERLLALVVCSGTIMLVPLVPTIYRPRPFAVIRYRISRTGDGRGDVYTVRWRTRMESRVAGNSDQSTNTGDVGDIYEPDEEEEYMSSRQQDYFRKLLTDWKRSILSASEGTLQNLQDGPIREADLNDRASSETDWGIELRTRDRQRKLIAKIEAALRRIDQGEYGYCQITGDPIGLRRLIARPVATMTVEAQEAHERREKISRDD